MDFDNSFTVWSTRAFQLYVYSLSTAFAFLLSPRAHPRVGGRTDKPGKVVGTDAVRYNWINLDRTTRPPKWNRKSRYRTWRRAQACAAKQAALISCYCSIVISNKTALLLNMVRYRNYMPRRLLQPFGPWWGRTSEADGVFWKSCNNWETRCLPSPLL